MNISLRAIARPVAVYIAVQVAITCPIWSFQHFATQDGAAHVYNAFLMSELVKGNPSINLDLRLNTLAVPNSTGHWILALLLQFFSASFSLKLMNAGTFALFVAVVAWLRYTAAGLTGLCTGILLGAAIGLNWLWFGGFYNFTIGMIGFVFLLTLFLRWGAQLNYARAVFITLIFIIIYLSHIVTFAIAAGSVFVMVLWSGGERRWRKLILVTIGALPSVGLAVLYRVTTSSAEELHPVWSWLSENSVFAILRDLLVDPFIIISRRTFPFVDSTSDLFVLLSPGLWTAIAVTVLAVAAVIKLKTRAAVDKTLLPFAFIFLVALLAAFLAPDDFGLSNGGIIRERVLLCAFCLFVPLFGDPDARIKRFSQICLICVIAFQSAALWDYASRTDGSVQEFSSSQTVVSDDDAIASVVVVEDASRFHSTIEPQLGLFTTIGKSTMVWDNYEIGHYLFPVITKDVTDRQFARSLAMSHAFVLNGPVADFNEALIGLDHALSSGNKRISKLILWGSDERVENVVFKWFEPEPIFQNDRVRVLRHRP